MLRSIAILVYAGGTAAYAVVDQRYQLLEFQHALVTATRRHPEHHFAAARVVQSFVTEEVSDLRARVTLSASWKSPGSALISG